MRIVIGCVFIGLLTSLAWGQQRPTPGLASETDVLQREVPGDDRREESTTDAFHTALGRVFLSGGMVRLLPCEGDSLRIAWRPAGSPLRQVLDDIVSKDPAYDWQVQEGVVNLLPSSGEPKLLSTRLNKFQLLDVSSASYALDQILKQPQLRKSMHKLRLSAGLTLVKSLSAPHPRRFSVRFNGGTLRQALNAIASAQGRAIWEYVEIRCDGKNEVVIRF